MLKSNKFKALLALAMLCLIAGVWLSSRDSQTTYKGRSLDYWLNKGNETELREALQAIGTNAIPRLFELLHADDGSMSEKLVSKAAQLAFEANVQVTIPFESAYTKWDGRK